jgi:hypothetical protein
MTRPPCAVLLLAALALWACARPSSIAGPAVGGITVTQKPVGRSFRLAVAPGAASVSPVEGSTATGLLQVLYPDVESLSLHLRELPLPAGAGEGKTWYLDRISYTPELDVRFGDSALLWLSGECHIFYTDRETGDRYLLKWVHRRAAEDAFWADVLPYEGRLLGAWVPDGKTIELLLLQQQGLVLQPVGNGSPAREVLRPFEPGSDICYLEGPAFQGFTAYDSLSRRLYLFRRDGGAVVAEALYPHGEVHFSCLAGEEQLILVYDSARSTLLQLQRRATDTRFEVVPVTLCEGTRSVYLGTWNGQSFYLFDEREISPRETAHFQLSLLFPSSGGVASTASGPELEGSQAGNPIRYEKITLLESPEPFQRFRALQSGDSLYVLYEQEGLNLLTLPLGRLEAPVKGNQG